MVIQPTIQTIKITLILNAPKIKQKQKKNKMLKRTNS